MKIIILLFMFLPIASHALVKEIHVNYKNLSYKIIQTKEKFEFKTGTKTISFPVKACNQPVFERIWSGIETEKYDLINFANTNKKDFLLFTENANSQKLAVNSNLSIYLQKLPVALQNLDIEVFKKCGKL